MDTLMKYDYDFQVRIKRMIKRHEIAGYRRH